jgi:4-diphosphocytidyl-2-C-methyl-D-erythritol kinase
MTNAASHATTDALITATHEAHAKLNLLLGVTPEVVAGKHKLTSVFTTIDLADTLRFTFDGSRRRAITIELTSAPGIEPLGLPPERNIVYAAVEMMENVCDRPLKGYLQVAIEKRIPPQGGLGGGSTDAAATLRFIAALWEMAPTDPRVLQAATALGADVSFFLYGGCALMGGSGETLLRRLPPPELDLVLVKPAEGIATAAAYRAFDANPQPMPSVERLVRLLDAPAAPLAKAAPSTPAAPPAAPASSTAASTPPSISPVSPGSIAVALANNLYPAACALMPGLEALVADIQRQQGVHAALLTGSGSTVFGVCEDSLAASSAAEYFAQKGYWAKACTTAW